MDLNLNFSFTVFSHMWTQLSLEHLMSSDKKNLLLLKTQMEMTAQNLLNNYYLHYSIHGWKISIKILSPLMKLKLTFYFLMKVKIYKNLSKIRIFNHLFTSQEDPPQIEKNNNYT